MNVNELLAHFSEASITKTEENLTYKFRQGQNIDPEYADFRQAYAVLKLRASKIGVQNADFAYIDTYANVKGFIITRDLLELGARGKPWFTVGVVV